MSVPARDSIECIFSFLPKYSFCETTIIQFLKQFGFERQDVVQTREGRFEQVRVYTSDLKRAQRLNSYFQKNIIQNVLYEQRRLAYKDWADKWKEDYQIQTMGQSFVVIPSWRNNEFKSKKFKGRIPIWIDPQSAFGSGEHETTRLIVRLMEMKKNRFDSFIDIGTGTGILSIIAAHCGANRIVGFDSDKPSAACARFNFNLNGLAHKNAHFFCAELAQSKTSDRFDLVCANINSRILESHRSPIVSAAKKGGWVLVSGILKQTYDSFREAFDGKDLRCLKVLRGRRWIALLYKKI